MKKHVFDNLDIIKIIRAKQLLYFIGQFILSSYQKKIAQKTGSLPGAEFNRAVELADETGATLVFSDRDIGITLKRAWRLTRFFDKMKFLASLFIKDEKDIESADIESMKNPDAIDTLIKGFGDELPVTKEVLIDERDVYLAASIQRRLGNVTIAVVGAGHGSTAPPVESRWCATTAITAMSLGVNGKQKAQTMPSPAFSNRRKTIKPSGKTGRV